MVKNINECGPNRLAFAFGVGDSRKGRVKAVGCPNTFHFKPQTFISLEDLLKFVLPQQPVVHENAKQAVTNGSVQQHGGDTGIDSTTQTKYHTVFAQLLLELLHR